MSNDKCDFCLNRWGCHDVCTRCERTECEYNHDGHCLEVKVLKRWDKQTGCIYFTNRNKRGEE